MINYKRTHETANMSVLYLQLLVQFNKGICPQFCAFVNVKVQVCE